MSDNEIQQPIKKGRTKKNGEPDLRSSSSAVNVSKARSKVKAFLKAGKQIIDNSDKRGASRGVGKALRSTSVPGEIIPL